jgi:hypothetical protein
MAVAYNAASQASGDSAGPSVSHTAAGSDRFVLIGVGIGNSSTISAISYGAQTPTLISANGAISLYRLTAPNTGAQTVSVTLSATAPYALGVISFTGVDQTTPVGTHATATNDGQTSISTSVSSAADRMVADLAFMVFNIMAADGTQTERVSVDSIDGGFISAGMSTKPGSASVTMTWTATSTFGDNYITVVPINAAAGAGGGVPKLQSFQRMMANN